MKNKKESASDIVLTAILFYFILFFLQPNNFFNEMYSEKLFNDISRIIHYTNTKNVVQFKYMQFIVSQLHIHNNILKSNIQNFAFYNHSAMVYELHSFSFFFLHS